MNTTLKTFLYVLGITLTLVTGYLFLNNYSELTRLERERAATTTEDQPEDTVPHETLSSHRTSTFLYGGFLVLGTLMVGGLIAYDVSSFFGNRAASMYFEEDELAQSNEEYEAADSAWRDGEFLEAIRLLRVYQENHPREIHATLRIAEIYEQDLNNPLAAALEYEEALKHRIKPEKWGWTAIRLANLYSGKLNNPKAALQWLERIIEEHPQTKAAAKALSRLNPEED